MPQIGEFTRTKNGYAGHIRTLSLDVEMVLIPAERSDAENAPDYRVHLRRRRRSRDRRRLEAHRREGRRLRLVADRRPDVRASRSAPTCSSPATTSPPGACTGTVRQSAASGTDGMPIRSLIAEASGRRPGGRAPPGVSPSFSFPAC